MGGWAVHLRLPAVFASLLFAATEIRMKPPLRVVLAAAALAMVAVSAATLAKNWQGYDRQFREFTASLRDVPRGARLLTVLDGDALGERADQPYWHMAEFAVPLKGAFTPLLFTTRGQHVVQLNPPYDGFAAATAQQGSPPRYRRAGVSGARRHGRRRRHGGNSSLSGSYFDIAVVVHLGGKRSAVPPCWRCAMPGAFSRCTTSSPTGAARNDGADHDTVTLLALIVLPLLARNGLTIPAHVPLDPNEGWNAAHALAAHLYPRSLMVNNYPPLSFYLVRAVTALTGDAIIAGRIIAFVSFLLVCGGIAAAIRRMGGGRAGAVFGALFFAAVLLVASTYVGIDDPQMLGHAVQMGALLLLLRGRMIAAALLFAASLFAKHNLLAPAFGRGPGAVSHRPPRPLLHRRRLGAFALGLAAFRLAYGVNLWTQLASPRLSSSANLQIAVTPSVVGAAAAGRGLRPPARPLAHIQHALCRVGAAAGPGLFRRRRRGHQCLLRSRHCLRACPRADALDRACRRLDAAAGGGIGADLPRQQFRLHPRLRRPGGARHRLYPVTPRPRAVRPAFAVPVGGQDGRGGCVHVGEVIKTGARDPAPLISLIRAHHFGALQLEDLDALGPQVRAAIAGSYRISSQATTMACS